MDRSNSEKTIVDHMDKFLKVTRRILTKKLREDSPGYSNRRMRRHITDKFLVTLEKIEKEMGIA